MTGPRLQTVLRSIGVSANILAEDIKLHDDPNTRLATKKYLRKECEARATRMCEALGGQFLDELLENRRVKESARTGLTTEPNYDTLSVSQA